jgi:ABC-type sugar transport system permease subunit
MAMPSLGSAVLPLAGRYRRWRGAAAPSGSGLARQTSRAGLLMVLPSVLFFAVFLVYPVLNAFWVSLTRWDLIASPRFVGLSNYARLLTDPYFLNSVVVTAYYTFGLLVVVLPLSLLLAILLDRQMKGRGFYQAVIFTPVVLSMVVVAMIWRAVYAPTGGLYLLFTEPFGYTNLQWLNDSTLAMPALIIVSVWKNVGYYMVIFLAGLQAIPLTYYEAARIDGAGVWRQFVHITIPLLRPYLLFVMVISIIKTAQSFSIVYTLTNGGPADATKVLPYLVYENAFGFFRMGYASSIAVLMFVVLLGLTIVQFRLLRTPE